MKYPQFEQAAADLEVSVETYLQMVRLFLDDTRSQLEALESAVKKMDADGADRIAHHIAGAAENLEFNDFGRAARELRTDLTSFGPGDPRTQESVQAIHHEFQRAEKQVNLKESN